MEDKDILIKYIAAMIEGLAVPYSLNKVYLGLAAKPWLDIRAKLGLFGYESKEQIENKLIKVLYGNS